MHARMQTVDREKIRRIRSSTVEPVLGTLVNYLAMRRVNTRGIKQASKCILMSAIAYNLKKLLRWEQTKIKTAVMVLKNCEKCFYSLSFKLWHCIHPYNELQPKIIFN